MNNQKIKILKFGGSSVGTAKAIRNVLSIVQNNKFKNLVVVVSAQQKITDMLLALASKNKNVNTIENHINYIVKDLNIKVPKLTALFKKLKNSLKFNRPQDQLQDLIASFGERISAHIITAYLNSQNINAVFVDAREIIVTDNNFTNANYNLEKTKINCQKLLCPLLFKNKKILIVTGFIGQDANGNTTTLGRGGSDLTATLLGQCLNANVIELWSDVDGIRSADPKKVKDSIVIPKLTYKEAIDLSNFGAKVVYPKALIPAMEANIPVCVLNTFNIKSKGTVIHSTDSIKSYVVTSKENITVITVYNPKMIQAIGYLAGFFTIFNKFNLSIGAVSVSEASVSVTVHNLSKAKEKQLITALKSMGEIKIINNCAIIAIISNHFKKNQNLFSLILDKLMQNNIHVDLISYGNSELNLTVVISDSDKCTYAINKIHKLLF